MGNRCLDPALFVTHASLGGVFAELTSASVAGAISVPLAAFWSLRAFRGVVRFGFAALWMPAVVVCLGAVALGAYLHQLGGQLVLDAAVAVNSKKAAGLLLWILAALVALLAAALRSKLRSANPIWLSTLSQLHTIGFWPFVGLASSQLVFAFLGLAALLFAASLGAQLTSGTECASGGNGVCVEGFGKLGLGLEIFVLVTTLWLLAIAAGLGHFTSAWVRSHNQHGDYTGAPRRCCCCSSALLAGLQLGVQKHLGSLALAACTVGSTKVLRCLCLFIPRRRASDPRGFWRLVARMTACSERVYVELAQTGKAFWECAEEANLAASDWRALLSDELALLSEMVLPLLTALATSLSTFVLVAIIPVAPLEAPLGTLLVTLLVGWLLGHGGAVALSSSCRSLALSEPLEIRLDTHRSWS